MNPVKGVRDKVVLRLIKKENYITSLVRLRHVFVRKAR